MSTDVRQQDQGERRDQGGPAEPQSTAWRIGRRVSDLVDPKNVIVAVSTAFGVHFGWKGLGWAAIAVVFSAVLPMAYIVYARSGGQWSERHLVDRAKRMAVLPVIVGSAAAGVALEVATSAPAAMVALTAAMWATITVVWPVTRWYKVSVHAAVVAGSFAMLAAEYGWWWLAGLVLVPVISWARVRVREHTVGQVVAGTVLGLAVAGGVYVLAVRLAG
ncbi:hypothetical protein ABTX81_30515 [Kitasatospora sp. NPDC097605]|uniref:hypothetical protein n=1 Tax=Kitasatospora sp. NPDC097605 TaxID=3157226 RepID=UPI00332F5FB8